MLSPPPEAESAHALWPRRPRAHFAASSPQDRNARPPVSPAQTTVRVSVILLALAGMAGHLAYLDALWWHALGLTAPVARNVARSTLIPLAAQAVVSLVCSLLSILLVLTERHRQASARALALAFGAWSYLMAYAGVTLLFRPGPGFGRDIFEAHFLIVEVIGLVGLLRFTAIFPRPLGEAETEPLETLPPALLPVHHFSVAMRAPMAPAIGGVAVLATLWGWTVLSGGALSDVGLSPGMNVVRFIAAGLVVMNLRRAWACATEGDRDPLTWLLVGLAALFGSLALLIGGNVLVAVTGFPEPTVAWRPVLLDFGQIGFLGFISLSVLSRGARDPAVFLRNAMTLTLVATLGLFLAAGLEALFGGSLVSGFAFRRGVGTAISFAVVLSTYRTQAAMIARILPV